MKKSNDSQKQKMVADNFNVSSRIRKALQKAVVVTEYLRLEEITTFSLVISLLSDSKSFLSNVYLTKGLLVYPDAVIKELISQKEYYEKVFKVPYLDEEDEEDEEDEVKETKEEVKITKEELVKMVKDSILEDTLKNYVENLAYAIDYPYSDNLKNSILDAGTRCRDCGQDYIDEENLLYSIFCLPETSASRCLDFVNDEILQEMAEDDIDDQASETYSIDILSELLDTNIYFPKNSSNNSLTIPKPLQGCVKILNDNYKKGEKCDILERDDEIERVWNILSKHKKSNAILLGKPGTGKTAIVEAITSSIVNGTCPEKFKGYYVIDLNVTSMVAGTKYRGEFEKKIEYLMNFILSSMNVIVFIDEIHHVVGAGTAEGNAMDLSGSLKPLLARENVKFIGATTYNEYERYIKADGAFCRRFEIVEIKEPKYSEVLNMINVRVKNLKKYHGGLRVSKEVAEYVLLCASCLNIETSNPDKTIDLFDVAMSVAENEGSKSLKKEHVEKVFKKNYENFSKMSDETRWAISYHEAGHFVASMLMKNILVDYEKVAVSIVPGFDFLGINLYEETDISTLGNMTYHMANIIVNLAGRVGENLYTSEFSSGADTDLYNASKMARTLIVSAGLSEGAFKNYSLDDKGFELSEMMKDRVLEESKDIIDSAYEKTVKLLNENKDKVAFIAGELMKKKMIKASDYYYLFD